MHGALSDEARQLLEDGERCFLVLAGPDGPVVRPLRYWHDGQHAWMTTAAAALPEDVLVDEVACAIWVPGEVGAGLA